MTSGQPTPTDPWSSPHLDASPLPHPYSISLQVNSFQVYRHGDPLASTLFVLLHGAGHTALSWALVAKYLVHSNEACQVMAMDFRSHGASIDPSNTPINLTQLSEDVTQVFNTLFGTSATDVPKHVVIVGHSLGGAVAVDLSFRNLLPNILGVVVLDVVEGTAMESLSTMRSILHRRPASFHTLEEAIRWSVSSGQLQNLQSARISIPSQLTLDPTTREYVWITDLFSTEPHWHGWFTGLSSKFLKSKCAKLLLLAGADRLERDKELTIGQMQGKFQVHFFHTGHSIQEDAPEDIVTKLIEFVDRYSRPLVLPTPPPISPTTSRSKTNHEELNNDGPLADLR